MSCKRHIHEPLGQKCTLRCKILRVLRVSRSGNVEKRIGIWLYGRHLSMWVSLRPWCFLYAVTICFRNLVWCVLTFSWSTLKPPFSSPRSETTERHSLHTMVWSAFLMSPRTTTRVTFCLHNDRWFSWSLKCLRKCKFVTLFYFLVKRNKYKILITCMSLLSSKR